VIGIRFWERVGKEGGNWGRSGWERGRGLKKMWEVRTLRRRKDDRGKRGFGEDPDTGVPDAVEGVDSAV
jgi:hypothetical protein